MQGAIFQPNYLEQTMFPKKIMLSSILEWRQVVDGARVKIKFTILQ